MSHCKKWLLFVLFWMCAASSHAIDGKSLRQLIEDQHLNSVESVLDALPFSFLSRYTLVFRSRSLQQASCAAPRVLVFSRDGKFILSFNGDAQQAGYNALEIMDFDGQQFKLQEIQFPAKSAPDSTSDKATFSDANPGKCLKCHSTPARPVWDTHPLWPGIIGERYRQALSPAEQQCLDQFLAKQSHDPRYRFLQNVQIYKDKNTFAPSAKTIYDANEKEAPNVLLSRLLGSLNMHALIYEMTNSQNFSHYRYAMLAAVTPECGEPDNYLPANLLARWKPDYAAFSALTTRQNAQQTQSKQIRLLSDHANGEYGASEMQTLTPLRFLAENGLHIATANWTTALEKQSYDFTTPQVLISEIDSQLREAVATDDPLLQNLASFRAAGQPEKYCSYLRKKSLAALQTYQPQNTAVASLPKHTNSAANLMQEKCFDCHQGDVGPILPFNQPQSLTPLLNQGSYAHGTLLHEIVYRMSAASGAEHMPAGTPLSADEQTTLLDYFKKLAQNATK